MMIYLQKYFKNQCINYWTICNVILVKSHVYNFLRNLCEIAVQMNENYAQTTCKRETMRAHIHTDTHARAHTLFGEYQ